MPRIRESELRSLARQHTIYKTAARVLDEAHRAPIDESFDIFLSHSSFDEDLILGLRTKILGMGFSVYVDRVDDADLDRKHVTRQTADRLRKRMDSSSSLVYAYSPNTRHSTWMPWELGYCDARVRRVAVMELLPTATARLFGGQEYLQLYPYVEEDLPKGQSKNTLWVQEGPNIYVTFREWLGGKPPTRRDSLG